MLFGKLSFLLGLIVLTLVGIPTGAFIGWSTGKVLRRNVSCCHRGPIFNLLDLPLGYFGLLAGFSLAFMGYSLQEQWLNGQLIYRKTTGYGDYAIPIALFSAAFAVVLWNLLISATRAAFQKLSSLQSSSRYARCFALTCGRSVTPDTKWKWSHLVLRVVAVLNTALMASEIVRPKDHVHLSMALLHYIALWLSASVVFLLFYAGIENWWMVKRVAVGARRGVGIDAFFALAWAVNFIFMFPRVWSLW